MLHYNDLKPGVQFIKDGEPNIVIEYSHVKKQRGKPIVQLKTRNLISGKLSDVTAHQNDSFEEAIITKSPVIFIYDNKGIYWFRNPDNPSDRFSLNETILGESRYYLIPELEVQVLTFKEQIINIELPIKVDIKVTEAPPNIKGNTADGGTKPVITETGLKVNTPLFIERGDTIRINTQNGTYTERTEKSVM